MLRRALPFAPLLVVLAIPASASASTKCGRIDIDYPNGEGGSSAVDIRATNVRCKPARRIVRKCQGGKEAAGWNAHFQGERIVMKASRGRRITLLIAGGGGCGSF
jgi:hypothetical protein